MNIEVKANVGDKCFITRRIKRATCPICQGEGTICVTPILPYDENNSTSKELARQVEYQMLQFFKNNVYKYRCPECNGKKYVVIKDGKYEVAECVINAIEVKQTEVIYKVVDDNGITRNLTENDIYFDRGRAEYECRIRNLERKIMNISDIKVPNSYKETLPCNEKLNKRFEEWRKFRKFLTEIYVMEDDTLFDGYTSYLVYKMLGINDVPVVVWPRDMLNGTKVKPYQNNNMKMEDNNEIPA